MGRKDSGRGRRVRRVAVFAAGVVFMSAGIALSIRSGLGVTPISSLPVAVNARWGGLSIGTATFLMNTAFVALQALLLRRRFPPRHLLQIPAVLFFGAAIDACLWSCAAVRPEAWAARLAVNLAAIPVLAFGVWLCVRADVLLMPGDGLAAAIGDVLRLPFAWAKVATDTSIVAAAALLGLATLGRTTGLREGTVLAMLLVGTCVRLFDARARRLAPPPPAAPARNMV